MTTNSRITIDPKICHGKPVIKNTRVLVSNILADLAVGQTFDQIIENYPNINNEDIKAALLKIELTNGAGKPGNRNSLKGIWKGSEIDDQLFEDAKKSMFKATGMKNG